jgi:hypothetical protein
MKVKIGDFLMASENELSSSTSAGVRVQIHPSLIGQNTLQRHQYINS